MDIEEYLAQKRSLERKKDDLESKEKLREQSLKSKKELLKEKDRPSFFSRPPHQEAKPQPTSPQPSRPQQAPDFYDPIRKMIVWNMLLLLVIVVMGVVLFFVISDDGAAPPVVVQTPSSAKQTPSTGASANTTSQEENETIVEEEPEVYEGPEIVFYAQDKEFGRFDSDGRLPDGGFLVFFDDYYSDLELYLENDDASRSICFIDKEVHVDTNFDGIEDLTAYTPDAIVEKLGAKDIQKIPNTIPAGLGEGYTGTGKVRASYEARCYYCMNDECAPSRNGEPGWDEDGETMKSATVIVNIRPPNSGGSGNSTNST